MEVKEVLLSDIVGSESNTRKNLEAGTEDVGIAELAESIRAKGLLSPVTVMRLPSGKYELIAGQRRFMACSRLRMMTIPAIIRDQLDRTDATVISLVENVHRADMNPIDKARAFQKIHEDYKDFERTAKETGVTIPTIKKYLALLNLAPSIQDRMGTAEGPSGIAAMSKLAERFSSHEEQEKALEEIGGFKLSVQIEILKRSGGDLEKLSELKEQALDGAFDIHTCREGLCFEMPEELKAEVKRILRTEDGFQEIVRRMKS
jgi:ParB family chromosome partitioning protein